MRERLSKFLEEGRVAGPPGSRHGEFVVRQPTTRARLRLLVDDGGTWSEHGLPPPAFEHVSVSVVDSARCPVWSEMAWVKEQCWEAEEAVLEYHVPRSLHVNLHPGCLHLWRPLGVAVPLPPPVTVG